MNEKIDILFLMVTIWCLVQFRIAATEKQRSLSSDCHRFDKYRIIKFYFPMLC